MDTFLRQCNFANLKLFQQMFLNLQSLANSQLKEVLFFLRQSPIINMVRIRIITANTATIPTNIYIHKLRDTLSAGDCMGTVVVISVEKMSVVGDVASTDDKIVGGEDVE